LTNPSAQGMAHGRATKNSTTLGWTDCGHYDPMRGTHYDPYRPGIVLDPFAGSGTTAIAAAQTGRDSVLIDLDHRNVELIRQRLEQNFRIVEEWGDGTTYRWTVETVTPTELAAIKAGQTSLFEDTA
jgi:ribosomal protein L11 methylase PrmA